MSHQRSKSIDTGISIAKNSSASAHNKRKKHSPPPRDSSLFNKTSQHSALMLPSISKPGGALVRSHSTTNLHDLVSSLHQQRERCTHHRKPSYKKNKKNQLPPLPTAPSSRPTSPDVRCNMDKKISDSITAENPATATAVTTALSIKRSGSLTKKLTDQASHYFRLVKKKSFRSLHGRNPKTTAIEATVVDARHNDGNIPRICRADVRVRIKEAPANLAQPLRAKIEEFAAATAATAGSLRSSSSNNGGSAADEDLALAALGKPIPCRPGSHGMSPPPSPPLSFDTLVQRGIRYHERGELDNATAEFAQAAKERSSVGMFFYGLSLCHGWGCEPQQDLGYLYLSKSASSGHPHILNIEHVLGGTSSEELLAAIYKLGTTFQSGNQFGCPKDEKVAAFYFRMAADLGHPDAQYALAKCYQHGLGVERDLKLATFYYHRAAAPDDDQPSWLYTNKSCSSSR